MFVGANRGLAVLGDSVVPNRNGTHEQGLERPMARETRGLLASLEMQAGQRYEENEEFPALGRKYQNNRETVKPYFGPLPR